MRALLVRTAAARFTALLWLFLILAAGCGGAAPPSSASADHPSSRPLWDPLNLTRLNNFAAYRVSSNSADPEDNDDSARPIAGETIELANLRGPGVVSHIWLTVAANEYGWPRLLRLRVYYDGSPTPSVDAPVGDFFGVGLGLERDLSSLLVRDSSSGRSRNSYWPMPFKKSCRITLTNEGRRRMSNVYYHVDWRAVPSLPDDVAYFHARYRQALPAPAGKPYELLRVSGRGHYAGTVLSVVQAQPGWFGEGDERFFIDGEKTPRIEGTGTEDYFNDAWTLRVGHGPYAGVSVADGTGTGSRMSAYRWHVPDPIPFERSLLLDVEHKGWTYDQGGAVRSAFEERPDLMSSVAFWYQDGIAKDQPELPYGARRLPHGDALQIEVEAQAAEAKATLGEARVERDVFWSKDLLLFKAEGPGARIDLPLDVPEDGYYELTAQVAHSFDYGNYTALVDNKPGWDAKDLEHEPGANTASTDRINAYFTEIYVAEDHLIGWIKLSKGRHTVSFVCAGKHPESTGYSLGIDTLILAKVGGTAAESPEARSSREAAARIRAIGEAAAGLGRAAPKQAAALGRALVTEARSEVRAAAAWSLGQMGAQAAPAALDLAAALKDNDPVVRGLAAVALRAMGGAGSPALQALISSLRDPDTAVRMAAANAIGAQRATTAVGALIEACRAKDEHVHVKRSLANALGQMGAAATSALPVLRELALIPRVRWAAGRAIRTIEAAGRSYAPPRRGLSGEIV